MNRRKYTTSPSYASGMQYTLKKHYAASVVGRLGPAVATIIGSAPKGGV
jgi:hypothetical protein